MLAVAFLPLILAALLNVLERPSKKWWIAGFIAVILSAAFHPMIFYMGAVGMAIMAALLVFTSRISTKRVFLGISMIVLGVFAAWILLPSQLTTLSFSGNAVSSLVGDTSSGIRATTGADSVIVPFSIRWNSFDVGIRNFNENYAGLGLALAGLLAPLLAWRKSVVLATVPAVASYVLATGTLTPIWEMIPLAAALEPRRFLFPAYLAVAVSIAATVSVLINHLRYNTNKTVKVRSALGIILFVALIAFDAFPMSERLSPDRRDVERSLQGPAENGAEGGRLFWNAIKDFAPYYFIGREIEVETIGRIGRVDQASRNAYPESAVETLVLYDVRSVLTDVGGFQPLANALVEQGFAQNYTRATQQMLVSTRPSVRVMEPPKKVGLLGVAASDYWRSIIPNSVVIPGPESVPIEYLNSFGAVIISAYSRENVSPVETVLLKYLEDGGRVIIVEPNRLRDDWFGVESAIRPVSEILTIGTGPDAFQTKPFAIGGGAFFGTFYDDAGITVFSGIDEDGEVVPIVQRRDIGRGAIYWVCCNIGNHTLVNPGRDFELAHALRLFFEDEIGGYNDVWPTKFGQVLETSKPSEIRFGYESDVSRLGVISVRPLPHRVAILDDEEELEIHRYGEIISIAVPAGQHQVLVTTRSNPISFLTVGIWTVSIAATIFLLRKFWCRLSSPSTRSGGPLSALRRWVFEPPFVREFAVGNGVLRICEPRLADRFDMKSGEGNYWRVASMISERSLALVLVELVAPADEPLDFDFSRLKLMDTGGGEFSAVSADGLRTRELTFPNLFHLVDIKNPLLQTSLSLNGGESVRGYIVFEFSTESEYPFIHDGFAVLH